MEKLIAMKKLCMLALAVGLLGLVATPAAFAKGKKDKTPQTVPSDVYAKYDKNSNGILDADEKAAIQKDFVATPTDPLLKPFDTNNDGKLSDDEIAAISATKPVDTPKKKKKNQ